ncbi:MAG: hypothetical protein GX297_02265 [Treponema sp.]|jgi:hypothetical protein|nr:hypothetical protein [Treponema sp.]
MSIEDYRKTPFFPIFHGLITNLRDFLNNQFSQRVVFFLYISPLCTVQTGVIPNSEKCKASKNNPPFAPILASLRKAQTGRVCWHKPKFVV